MPPLSWSSGTCASLRVSPQAGPGAGGPPAAGDARRIKRSNRNLDYVVVDFADLGLPQHRRRLIAGTRASWTVRAVLQGPSDLHGSAGADHAQALHARVDGQRCARSTNGNVRLPIHKTVRRVTRPWFTIVSSTPQRWYAADFTCVRCLNMEEHAVLRASRRVFPPETLRLERLRGIGKALPPPVMRRCSAASAAASASAAAAALPLTYRGPGACGVRHNLCYIASSAALALTALLTSA